MMFFSPLLHVLLFVWDQSKKKKKNRGGALKKSTCSLDVEKSFCHIDSLQWLDKTWLCILAQHWIPQYTTSGLDYKVLFLIVDRWGVNTIFVSQWVFISVKNMYILITAMDHHHAKIKFNIKWLKSGLHCFQFFVTFLVVLFAFNKYLFTQVCVHDV